MGFREKQPPQAGGRIELKRGVPLKGFPDQNRLMVWMSLLLIVPMFGLVAVLARRSAEESLAAQLWAKLSGDPQFLLTAAALAPVLIYTWAAGRYERLIVSDAGVEYRSPFQGLLVFLQRFLPGWSLRWDEIKAVGLLRPGFQQQPVQWKLTLIAGGASREVQPLGWVNPLEPPSQRKLSFWQLVRRNSKSVETAVHESPLVRALVARGYDLGAAPPTAALGFDLMSHRGLAAMVVLFFGAGLYALIDGFFTGPYAYVVAPPLDGFVAAAVLAAIFGWMLSRGAPQGERLALLALLIAASAAAMHPGQLRINAWTDADGPQTHVYQRLDAGHYRATDPALPELRFHKFGEYWGQFGKDTTHEFELVRGALEFHQLHEAPLRQQMREFYRKQD